jgi:medium-chain acyl-[acyl-carrier-protein] hydrolase
LKIKRKTIVQYFQNIAIKHSESLGYNTERYEKEKVAWVLNKLFFEVYQMPKYSDEINIVTWSMGIKGFKGTRRFEIIKNNKIIITGVSLWLYIDTEKKKLKKVPSNVIEDYSENNQQLLTNSLDFPKINDFEINEKFLSDLRISDFDNNLHLNNISYVDILDSVLFNNIENYTGFENLYIIYLKEIEMNKNKIEVGLKICNDTVKFKFLDNNNCFAKGECKISKRR